MHAIIGTWKMCYEGIAGADQLLTHGVGAGGAVVHAIMNVENNPAYTSVGYGGLPNRDGHVFLDAGYMNGSTLRYGGVMSVEGIANPILAAQKLCGRQTNCLLAGRGAEQFAIEAGLTMKDMRTPECMARFREAVQKEEEPLMAYRGHDTVCVIGLDKTGHMVVGTSTSGLFMKASGRVGDSPIIGSGFYCDARYGGAAATGLGEDIMRGCLSYEIVSLMKHGISAQEACEKALHTLNNHKIAMGEESGSISVIALSPDGQYGAATTLPLFPFVTGTSGGVDLQAATFKDGHTHISTVSEQDISGEP